MKKKKQKCNYEKCRKCVYQTPFGNVKYACGYLLLTGKMRPCEGGKECTAYLEFKSNKELRQKLIAQMKKMPQPNNDYS
jgi:hypothetical protein